MNPGGNNIFRPFRPVLEPTKPPLKWVKWKRNVMAHAQKPDLVFQGNGRVHLYRRWCQFSRLLAAEVCASAVVMLDRPCSHKVHECWLPTTPLSTSLLLPCFAVCHQIPFLLYLVFPGSKVRQGRATDHSPPSSAAVMEE